MRSKQLASTLGTSIRRQACGLEATLGPASRLECGPRPPYTAPFDLLKPITIKLILALAGILAADVCARAAASARKQQTMDFGWKFALGDQAGAQEAGFDDSKWASVDLPHDWSIHLDFDKKAPSGRSGGFLPTGIGWYRKTFNVPEADKGRRVAIEFEGIREHGEVFINGHSLGERPYGYTSVVYDMTPHLYFGGKSNIVSVRVDNSRQPNSRWYAGSGIYRHSWLVVTDGLHIPQWGTCATTPQVNSDSATVSVTVQVVNQEDAATDFTLVSMLIDSEGREIQNARSTGRLEANGHGEFTQQIGVDKPILWSIDRPYLYRVRSTLNKGDETVDTYDTPIGIRTSTRDSC
jgi:beta-galactosidase